MVYSEEAKCDLLGISLDMIRRCGAVSAEIARAMATGAVARSPADIAVSVTGFAGAGAPGDEPGLVHFGWANRAGAVRHRVEHFGDVGRGPIRLAAVRVALEMIDEALDG